ncbi:MAG: hypothetical protein WED00_13110 [Aquisalimonadaceae bacterium]
MPNRNRHFRDTKTLFLLPAAIAAGLLLLNWVPPSAPILSSLSLPSLTSGAVDVEADQRDHTPGQASFRTASEPDNADRFDSMPRNMESSFVHALSEALPIPDLMAEQAEKAVSFWFGADREARFIRQDMTAHARERARIMNELRMGIRHGIALDGDDLEERRQRVMDLNDAILTLGDVLLGLEDGPRQTPQFGAANDTPLADSGSSWDQYRYGRGYGYEY